MAIKYRGAVYEGYEKGPYMLEQFEHTLHRASSAARLTGRRGTALAAQVSPTVKAVFTPGSIIIMEK